MKLELERDEIKAALEHYAATVIGGKWTCTTADYSLPRTVELEQQTPELAAKLAAEAEEEKRITEKWAEEAKAAAQPLDAAA